MPLHVLQLNTT